MKKREPTMSSTSAPEIDIRAMACPMCGGTGESSWPGLRTWLKCESCGGGGRILTALPLATFGLNPTPGSSE